MSNLLSKTEYEKQIALSRDNRISWWREARFGMFITYGLYSQVGRGEWLMPFENWTNKEYEILANSFKPEQGAPRQWAQLAKKAGMKYMVFTTRHHEGFSLWDSKVNPYNSVNFGPGRDIVREYVDACREYDLKIGFYTSMMDWHHPDGWKAAYDKGARDRFNSYTKELNRELCTNYGKIDILWYDVPLPMSSWEGWDSLEMNQMVRQLQPDIIINGRCRLSEDFGTPEETIQAENRDWETCMTFNGISWGYIDSEKAKPFSYNAHQIIRMLNRVTGGGGNLLLNIGPKPDGSIPHETIEPLTTVGNWLSENGKAVYGKKVKCNYKIIGVNDDYKINGISNSSFDGRNVFVWNWIWPDNGEMSIGGFESKVKSIRLVRDSKPVEFDQIGQRIILKNLPSETPDKFAGITVFKMEFEEIPIYSFASYYPQIHGV